MNKFLFSAVAASVLLSGCATVTTPTEFGAAAVPQRTVVGTVYAVRPIKLSESQQGEGAGALVGGGIGAAIGAVAHNALLGGIAGAIAGVMIGSQAKTSGELITIKFPNGELVSVPQVDSKSIVVRPGEKVLVVENVVGFSSTIARIEPLN